MAGVQEMISKQTEASKKFMIETIQAAMQVSTIDQQQQTTISVLPPYDATLSNAVNNEHRQSTSNNVITTSSTFQNKDETLANLTQENRNQPSSDTQVTNVINTGTVNEYDLHWKDMYETDEESDNDNMEGLKDYPQMRTKLQLTIQIEKGAKEFLKRKNPSRNFTRETLRSFKLV